MARKLTNIPAEPLRWSALAASREFCVHYQTLKSKLAKAGIASGDDTLFSTRQILSAIYSDEKAQRLRKVTAEAEHTELRSAILRGEYRHKAIMTEVLDGIVAAIKQIIEASELTLDRKTEILQNLAGIKPAISRAADVETDDE